MKEVELKFQVPTHQQQAVKLNMQQLGATTTRLQAIYFDTSDRLLAQHQMALRLRREDDAWVQTLKGQGAHVLERLESNHEHAPSESSIAPALDLQAHAASVVGQRLLKLVGQRKLHKTYQTDITRHHLIIDMSPGEVEVALDIGQIIAGTKIMPVFEVEFELKKGTPLDLLSVARSWVDQFHLWLDVRSKAERGERLMPQPATLAPNKTSSRLPTAADNASVHDQWKLVLAPALQRVLHGISELSDDDWTHADVATTIKMIQRLQSAQRWFGALGADASFTLADNAERVLSQLKTHHETSVHVDLLSPLWMSAHTQALSFERLSDDSIRQWLRSPATTHLWLDWLSCLMSTVTSSAMIDEDLLLGFMKKIHRRFRQDFIDAQQGSTSSDRMFLRQLIARQRDALDIWAHLFPTTRLKRYRKALSVWLKSLDLWHDHETTLRAVHVLGHDAEPRRSMAIGWLLANTVQAQTLAIEAGEAYAQTSLPWKDSE